MIFFCFIFYNNYFPKLKPKLTYFKGSVFSISFFIAYFDWVILVLMLPFYFSVLNIFKGLYTLARSAMWSDWTHRNKFWCSHACSQIRPGESDHIPSASMKHFLIGFLKILIFYWKMQQKLELLGSWVCKT